MELDPGLQCNIFKKSADRDRHLDACRQKVWSRKPLSEGTVSVSQVVCVCAGEGGGAVCPHGSTFSVVNQGGEMGFATPLG